jgi:hypothetical protein
VSKLCSAVETTAKSRATIVRQVYICLWVLFVWARDADNVEGLYRASEFAILHAWNLISDDISKSSKIAEEIRVTFSELVALHFLVWDELLDKKILPISGTRHAVSTAVDSIAAVDVNIKLFEVLGRGRAGGECCRRQARNGKDDRALSHEPADLPVVQALGSLPLHPSRHLRVRRGALHHLERQMTVMLRLLGELQDRLDITSREDPALLDRLQRELDPRQLMQSLR